jgi:putative DNA primase/helicase
VKEKDKEPKLSKKEKRAAEIAALKNLVDQAAHPELFHTEAQETFASVNVKGHTETYPVHSENFKRLLRYAYYKMTGGAMEEKILKETLRQYEAMAEFDGPELPVFLRVGHTTNEVFIDLCDDKWQAVHITGDGWRVVQPQIKFARRQGMLALPTPTKDAGALAKLNKILAHLDNDSRTLAKCFLLGALHPKGPFPLLLVTGEQGSGKTSLCLQIRSLIDPSEAPTTTAPRNERDLMIAASKSWLQAFENLSTIKQDLSDALCRLATGGAMRTRKLYKDDQEMIYKAVRPAMLNSIIDGVATSGDLADRALLIHTKQIPPAERRTDASLKEEFEKDRAAIFGLLCTAVSVALRNQDNVDTGYLPRMADFAKWAAAGESALGLKPGDFAAAYTRTRNSATMNALEASPVYVPLMNLMENRTLHKTDMTDLLNELGRLNAERGRDFPKTALELRGQLNRLVPLLRVVGVTITFGGRTTDKRRRLIEIEKHPPHTSGTPAVPPAVAARRTA